MGVADPIAELRALTTNIANLCHYSILPMNLKIDYSSTTYSRQLCSNLASHLHMYSFGGPGMSGGETILVVEDADAIRNMVCAMLGQQGYQCLEAADGADALRMLDETTSPVHLVLTDVIMPKMTGAELGRHLVRVRPELRIVFMSGYSDDPSVRDFERVPPIFLAKPFTATALLQKVRQALDQPWSGLPGSGLSESACHSAPG
jgi:CheY-like chemotaxis protein